MSTCQCCGYHPVTTRLIEVTVWNDDHTKTKIEMWTVCRLCDEASIVHNLAANKDTSMLPVAYIGNVLLEKMRELKKLVEDS